MNHPVGLQTLHLTDPTRRNWQNTGQRPLVTDIWYPANENAQEQDILIGPPDAPLFVAGRAAREADLAASPQHFPLVMLSHGTGGAAMQHGWLATVIAAHGYIVAGVNHHGNTALEPYVIQGFSHVWERARDVSEVLTQLLGHPTFGSRIRRDQIGAAGFSLGGYTVILLAGGITDLKAFDAAYKNSGRKLIDEVPPEFPDPAAFVAYFQNLVENDTDHKQSFRDERIKAGFSIAPPLGEAFTPEGLKPIQIPIQIVVGAADTQAPPERNAEHFAKWITGSELTILPVPVGHYVFLADATELGKEMLPMLCVDPPRIDRAAIHSRVSEMACTFSDTHLLS